MGEAAAGPGFGDFAEMEKEVVGWLLTRRDVKDCVEVAQAGNEEEATEMLLAVVQGLLQAQPKAKAVTKRAAKRKGSLPGRAEEAESGQAKRRWLEDCTRALEADRLESEELRRAKSAEIQEAPAAPPRPVPLFWRIDLPEVLKVLSQQGVLPRSFLPVARPHVTLLYLGGEDEDRAAAKAQMSLQSFRAARESWRDLRAALWQSR
ncbi:unnamed protein product [Effrenium voratum]|nr:unnamed protein product [Effrenium voratum]